MAAPSSQDLERICRLMQQGAQALGLPHAGAFHPDATLAQLGLDELRLTALLCSVEAALGWLPMDLLDDIGPQATVRDMALRVARAATPLNDPVYEPVVPRR